MSDFGWNILAGAIIGTPVGVIGGATLAAATLPLWGVPLAGVAGGVVGFYGGALIGGLTE